MVSDWDRKWRRDHGLPEMQEDPVVLPVMTHIDQFKVLLNTPAFDRAWRAYDSTLALSGDKDLADRAFDLALRDAQLGELNEVRPTTVGAGDPEV